MPTPVATAAGAVAAPPPVAGKPGASNGVAKAPPAVAKPNAPPVGTTPPAEAPAAFIKVKIDGEDREFTREQAERLLSKGGFADKTTQAAKEAIREAQRIATETKAREDAFNERLKTDLAGVLKERGIDFDEAALARLDKKVAEGKMTPEQRDAAIAKEEAKQLKEKLEKIEKERSDTQQQQRTTQLQRNIEKTLVDAAKRAGLTIGPGTGQEGNDAFYAVYESFAEAFELGLLPADGLQPHHADRIVEAAQERINGSFSKLEKAVLGGLKGEQLKARLGPAVYKEVLEYELEQVRSRRPGYKPSAAGAPPPAAPASRAPSQYITPREFDAKRRTGGA